MIAQQIISGALFIAGLVAFSIAVVHERRMHRHRQPGVGYAEATLRRDGGWRNEGLFTAAGLAEQRKASRAGVTGAALCVLALLAWIFIGWLVSP